MKNLSSLYKCYCCSKSEPCYVKLTGVGETWENHITYRVSVCRAEVPSPLCGALVWEGHLKEVSEIEKVLYGIN